MLYRDDYSNTETKHFRGQHQLNNYLDIILKVWDQEL